MKKIKEIEKVKSYDYEMDDFIVAKIGNGKGKIIIRISRRARDTFKLLESEIDGPIMYLGGGILGTNHKTKTIKIWSCNAKVGPEPDRKKTAKMLREAFPEYEVTILNLK